MEENLVLYYYPQITLEPGQVLYVPPQWWHYVECVTPAISVNTWIEMVCLMTTTVFCKRHPRAIHQVF